VRYIIGVDEVGRGCIGGSMFACGCLILDKDRRDYSFLKDSKKIRDIYEREKIAHKLIYNPGVIYVVKSFSSDVIDKIGVHNANIQLITKVCDELIYKLHNRNIYDFEIFVDGNMRIKLEYYPQYSVQSIVKGDNKIEEIKAASIIAKYNKDCENIELEELYPQFSFTQHSGYITKKHLQEIEEWGYIPGIHRRSFRTFNKMENLKKYYPVLS